MSNNFKGLLLLKGKERREGGSQETHILNPQPCLLWAWLTCQSLLALRPVCPAGQGEGQGDKEKKPGPFPAGFEKEGGDEEEGEECWLRL